MELTLQKVLALEEHPAYAVTDRENRIVGFLASTKMKENGEKVKKWAFTYVESQFRQFVNYRYASRLEALDALIASRNLNANHQVTKVVKTPILL